MKRISTVFLIVGIVMFIFAVGFVWTALNHPNYSFTIPLGLTYAIYLFYFFANIACFVLFGIFRHDENKKLKKRK